MEQELHKLKTIMC